MGAIEILNLGEAFDEKQSRAIAQFFDSNAATKRDIEEVKLEIENVRAELKGDIEKVRAELEIARAELKSDIEKVRADLADKMLRYQIGGVISIGLIIALVRVFG